MELQLRDEKAILARHRRCPNCGNPREETGGESQFDFGPTDPETGRSLRESVTEPKLLNAAAAGVDWACGYCGATNRGDAPGCGNCRAERANDWRTRTQAREERKPWVCDVCGTRNEGPGAACGRCFELAPDVLQNQRIQPRARPLSAFWRRLPVENPLALRTRVGNAMTLLVLLGLAGLAVGRLVWGAWSTT